MTFERRTGTIPVTGGEVTVARWGPGPAEIVMLHDGLGSIDQWRSIPGDVATATGKTVLAYDRPGHGKSTPVPSGAWPADWLHLEADRFGALLNTFDVVDAPLIVGHSDGGSIALLHGCAASGSYSDSPSPIPTQIRSPISNQIPSEIRGIVTLAAHSWVEPDCFRAIVAMRANPAPIVKGLARDHANPEAVFEAWSGAWVSDEFQRWDIRPELSAVECPTLIAQGAKDEYAPQSHAVETAAAIGNNAQHLILDGVGHLLHHQDPKMVVDLITEVDRTLG